MKNKSNGEILFHVILFVKIESESDYETKSTDY